MASPPRRATKWSSREVIRELVRRTAGLPQVLHALGARIASRPGWSIAEAKQRLGRPDPRSPVLPPECEAIERPYESAMAQLSPAQARAFRLLSMADGPDISVAAASAVLDLPLGDTAALVESLVDVHLLEPGGVDRYYYHEPLRMFARSRAYADDGPKASQAALTRLVRFNSAEEPRLPAPRESHRGAAGRVVADRATRVEQHVVRTPARHP